MKNKTRLISNKDGESAIINEWDRYWKMEKKRMVYNFIASFYRNVIIKNSLNHFVKDCFKPNSKILHAGCGGGEVDKTIKKHFKIVALDISLNALRQYKKNNGGGSETILGNIFNIPIRNSSFDGVYNLGVMEHYTENEIQKILKEFSRVLKARGRLLLFWPPEYGISVIFFKILAFISKKILRQKRVKFHPDEISRIKSLSHLENIFQNSNFSIIKSHFGAQDLFTYLVIVAQKK